MKKLALIVALFSTQAYASPNWEEVGDVVAPQLSDERQMIEVCIDDICNQWTYVSYEVDEQRPVQPVSDPDELLNKVVDGILGLGSVSGTVKVTHTTKEVTESADGSRTTKESSTSVEVNASNGKKKKGKI